MLAAAQGRLERDVRTWSKPASDTEEEKAARAADMVRTAVREHAALARRTVEVYATWFRTGTTRTSGRRATSTSRSFATTASSTSSPPGSQRRTIGFTTPATYTFDTFRGELEAALRAKFGTAVVPCDKTFNVPENTYRLEAEYNAVLRVPALQWCARPTARVALRRGRDERVASGRTFVNWHEDHYREGVRATSRRAGASSASPGSSRT